MIPPLEPSPPESVEVQVDMTTTSARYRHNSGGSGDSPNEPSPPKTDKVQGSPTSSRSVNFIAEEVIGGHYGRSKRYKRQSVSVGDKINEHSEHNLERMSIRSYTEEDYSLDVSGTQKLTCALQEPRYQGATGMSPRSSLSYDSMPSTRHSSSPTDLTEVESDRPVVLYSRINPGRLDLSSSEASSETVSPDTPSTSTQDGKEWGNGSQQLSEAESDELLHRQVRRTPSCELAMQQGRLSPQMA